MIIRRDCMLHTPPSAQMIAAAAARGFSSPPPPSLSPITNPASNSSPNLNNSSPISLDRRGWSGNVKVGRGTGAGSPYTLNPLQQREAMQREAWEKERNILLKKASNAQGDSVERLVRAYFAV